MSNENAKVLVGKWRIVEEGSTADYPWAWGLPLGATFWLKEEKGEFAFVPDEKCAGLFANKKSFDTPPEGVQSAADGQGELTMNLDYEGSTATFRFKGNHSKKNQKLHIDGPKVKGQIIEMLYHGGPHGEPV